MYPWPLALFQPLSLFKHRTLGGWSEEGWGPYFVTCKLGCSQEEVFCFLERYEVIVKEGRDKLLMVHLHTHGHTLGYTPTCIHTHTHS